MYKRMVQSALSYSNLLSLGLIIICFAIHFLWVSIEVTPKPPEYTYLSTTHAPSTTEKYGHFSFLLFCVIPSLHTYVGQIRDLQYGLIEKTLCMSAQQSVSTHYNVHSLYGMTEAKATLGYK